MRMIDVKRIAIIALAVVAIFAIAASFSQADADAGDPTITDAYYAGGQVYFSVESMDTHVWAWITNGSDTPQPSAPSRVVNGKADASFPATLSEGKYKLYVRDASDSSRVSNQEIVIVNTPFVMDPQSLTIGIGKNVKLSVDGAVCWAVDKDLVSISYDSEGATIVGKEQGKATISVWQRNNLAFATCDVFVGGKISIEPEKTEVTLYPQESLSLGVGLEGLDPSDIVVSSKNSGVVSVSGKMVDGKVVLNAGTIGSTAILIYYRYDSTISSEIRVSVINKPVDKEPKDYTFFIQMKYDADKVKHSVYNQSMLEAGFTLEGRGTSALDAFVKVCAENNIPFVPVSTGALKGWFGSLFGLGDVNLGDGLWKYWVQYHEGSYNQWTLGYYTDGGNFQFIYDITSEDMSGDGAGGNKPDDQKPSITDNGEIKTGTSSEKKNEDGSTTRVDTETTEGLDGSKHEVETRTDISEDGSTKTTTTTTTKTDPEGNQTKSESVTVVEKIKDADGNDAERKTVTEKDEDGNVKQSVSDITTSKDGTVTEKTKGTETKKDGSTVDSSTTTETKKDGSAYSETTSTVKDANGNVTGTTKSETTTEKISGGTKSTTNEISHDKDGNITGMKEIEETKTESGTKIVERSKDADGNVTGSSEKTVETQAKGNGSVTTTTEVSKDADGNAVSSTETKEQVVNKTIAGGKTQTTTTTDSKTTDSSGNVVSSTESAVVVKNKDGTPESFESTKAVKDQNGTIIEEIKKGTTNTKDSDGNEVSKTEYIKTTPEGKTSVDSETVFKKIDNGSQTDSTKTTVVKNKDGKVIDETKVIKTGKNTETDTEKKNSSSTETIRNGVSETKESSSVESKEVSGLKSSVEVEKKDGKVTKAESVTTLPTKDGSVDADSVQKAIDQSSAAMDEVSLDNGKISKTIEVRNDSGASVTVSPEAIGKISEHGAGLKVGSDNESIHVDDKVVENLSGNADKDVKLGMEKNVHDDLNDKQKQIVGDRQFIVLGAFVGDNRIHELGGVATVVFGYELRDGDDPSRLCVWYVDDNGVRTKMTASFDQSTGRFTMETTHFSVFMVAPEDEPVPTPDDSKDSDDSGNGSDTMLYVGIAAIAIVLIAAVAAIHRRKA